MDIKEKISKVMKQAVVIVSDGSESSGRKRRRRAPLL